uniref:Chitin-binding type-2 domain-containing protein n=1 Tax=Strigamia maritima TaxID=126957 RepID=T1IK24_STRMM
RIFNCFRFASLHDNILRLTFYASGGETGQQEMKSIWFYYTLTLYRTHCEWCNYRNAIPCSLFQLVSCYLFRPPHVPAQYLIASKPRHAGQFVQLENISQTKSPVAYLRPSFKSLTIPFPKVSSEPSLVPDSTPNPVTVYSETPIKKPKAKTTRTTRISGKNDIKDFIKEMDAEKEHEKKLSDILPLVTFDCHDISEGYYADVAFQCEVFHYCGKPSGKRFTFFCPPGSRFNQMHLICDYEMFQGCDKSHEYFHLNDKMHPKDDKNVSSTKTHYHQINTTSIPPSHFTYKSVSTTPRQISAVTLKSNLIEVKETSYKRPDRSRYSQRQWTMAYPHGPMVMRVPSRMGKLQPATNHIPTSRVLLNPHYIPMIRDKKQILQPLIYLEEKYHCGHI